MKFNITEVSDIKVGDLQITKRMFGTVTIWQNVADFDYVFYEYKDFLALPERKVVDTGDLYPSGFDGTMYGSTFVVPGVEGISYPAVPGASVIASEWFYINAGDSGGGAMPNDDYCNEIGFVDPQITLADKDNDNSLGWTLQVDIASSTGSYTGESTNDDGSGFFADHQFYNSRTFANTECGFTFGNLDDTGIYEVRVSGSRAGASSGIYNTSIDIDGDVQVYDGASNTTEGSIHTNLTTDGSGNISGTLSGTENGRPLLAGFNFKRIG